MNNSNIQRLIKVDIPHWQSGSDNFTSLLFSMIQKADPHNKQKLRSLWPDEVAALMYWQAEREKIVNPNMLPVVSVMIAKKDLHFCNANEKAVVFEHYDRTRFDQDNDDNLGISLIFSNGFYDGFSRKDLELCSLVPCNVLIPKLENYTFVNVTHLMQDYCNGVFDLAFKTN